VHSLERIELKLEQNADVPVLTTVRIQMANKPDLDLLHTRYQKIPSIAKHFPKNLRLKSVI
jgi:hypothetical protein